MNHSSDDPDSSGEPPARPSRSAVKREHAALQALVRRCAALPERQLHALPLAADVREALVAARRMQRQAFERQIRYVSGLIPIEERAGLEAALEQLLRPQHTAVRAFHDLERWRERLLAGDEAVCDELAARFPDFDRVEVLRLAAAARHEAEAGHRPRAARLLFRQLARLVNAEPGGG